MILDGGLVPVERHQQILREALTQRVVRVKSLAEVLGVHEMTVRRDLDALVEQGLLERIHGGARLREQASAEVAYHLRAAKNTAAKDRIARAALELVSDGDTVAIDASTTGLALARALAGRSVRVIVTGLDAATALAGSGTPFILAGGTFHATARSFVGALAIGTLSRLNPDKAFFSAKGFTPRAGFTDAHMPEVDVKGRLIASSALAIALLDHTKFGHSALGTIATPSQIDVLVTDREPPDDARAALAAAGTRVVVAQEPA